VQPASRLWDQSSWKSGCQPNCLGGARPRRALCPDRTLEHRDVVVPDMDYVVVENMQGKFDTHVEMFNKLRLNVQQLVGFGV
jgi:hypothetical protein